MSELAKAFRTAKNIGDLAQAWGKTIVGTIGEIPKLAKLKLQASELVSVVAPSALLATAIERAGLGSAPVRVLVLGRDPMFRLDEGRWCSLAADFLGMSREDLQVIYQVKETALTNLNEVAVRQGLREALAMSDISVQAGVPEGVTLALWIHPANEVDESIEIEAQSIALALLDEGIPVIAASFNEQDLLVQNFLLGTRGANLEPIGGEIERGGPAINRLGISTKAAGVVGGWGAILTSLVRTEISDVPVHKATVMAAFSLMRLEGLTDSQWTIGQIINGVSFNRVLPVALLGGLAVVPSTGHVIEEGENRSLSIVGSLWRSLREGIEPCASPSMLVSAAKVKLLFGEVVPRDEKLRAKAIGVLEAAGAAGVVEARVALARAYEAMGTPQKVSQAELIYRETVDLCPLSAYACAYLEIAKHEMLEAERLMSIAAEQGYPPAMTDLGKLLAEKGDLALSGEWLVKASDAGDPEASFLLGEQAAQSGDAESAMNLLQKAAELRHQDAINLCIQLCALMLKAGLGKRTDVKRTLREMQQLAKKVQARNAVPA